MHWYYLVDPGPSCHTCIYDPYFNIDYHMAKKFSWDKIFDFLKPQNFICENLTTAQTTPFACNRLYSFGMCMH